MLERLQKLLAQAGISSRREAESMISSGRVTVNGEVVTELGTKADPDQDMIAVDGRPVRPVMDRVYILLHKPAGYVTTLKDPQGRPLVTDLLKEVKTRVFPVGRLDYNTEGLLLLTNDGEWANRLAHPRHEVDKEYHVRVRWSVEEAQLEQLRRGVVLDDGPTAPAGVRLLKASDNNTWLSITIHEGRYRQVRRMCDKVGLTVVRLRRARYGALDLGPLKPGEFRMLTPAEVLALTENRVAVTPPAKPRQPARKPAGTAGQRGPRRTDGRKTGQPAEGESVVQTLVWRKPGTDQSAGKQGSAAKVPARGKKVTAPASSGRPVKRQASSGTGLDSVGSGETMPRHKSGTRKAGPEVVRPSVPAKAGNKPATGKAPDRKHSAGSGRVKTETAVGKPRRTGARFTSDAVPAERTSRPLKPTSTGKRPASKQPGRPGAGRKGPKGRGPGRS